MHESKSPVAVFFACGLLSGILSGVSVVAPPLGLIAPGLLFGVAIFCAIHASIKPIAYWQGLLVIGASSVAFPLAIIGSLLAMRLTGVDNGFVGGAVIGAIGGGIGATVIATSLVFVLEDLNPLMPLGATMLSGVIFGALFLITGISISDYTEFGHPIDDIVAFPLWQAGVAATISQFRDPQDQLLNQTVASGNAYR